MTERSRTALTDDEALRYLGRLGIELSELSTDIHSLERLHLAHLEQVPFENLDIVFSGGVAHDRLGSIDKIIGSPHGGWCFELNGALSLLLEWLGFDVKMLGAAVLLNGPSRVIEHLLLEVAAPGLDPHLVDVGFGASFDLPLALNTNRPQDAASGTFELMASPQGTTVARHDDGVPTALLRFKRVAHRFEDFFAVAQSMQVNPTKSWSSKPFATRRLPAHGIGIGVGEVAGRVTLSHRELIVRRGDDEHRTAVAGDDWTDALHQWFGISSPWRGEGNEHC